jgi:molybdopterin molybdotransferase
LLGGASVSPLPLLHAKLSRELSQRAGLTRFLPARLSDDGATITPESWQGSGDICALARANAFLVTEPDREYWAEGDQIRVLLK